MIPVKITRPIKLYAVFSVIGLIIAPLTYAEWIKAAKITFNFSHRDAVQIIKIAIGSNYVKSIHFWCNPRKDKQVLLYFIPKAEKSFIMNQYIDLHGADNFYYKERIQKLSEERCV